MDWTSLSLESAKPALAWMQEPESLFRKPEYRKRPGDAWIGPFFRALDEGLTELCAQGQQAFDRSAVTIVQQLQVELAEHARQYNVTGFSASIEAGLSGDHWFLLNHRSWIEAYLRAPRLIERVIEYPPEVLARIEAEDTLLRSVGSRLQELQPESPSGREPPHHWWWHGEG
ncbi:MAG: hypothetical protein ACK47B_04610 [Armatimonadota bacterium]